jgi:hypothetical protein
MHFQIVKYLAPSNLWKPDNNRIGSRSVSTETGSRTEHADIYEHIFGEPTVKAEPLEI